MHFFVALALDDVNQLLPTPGVIRDRVMLKIFLAFEDLYVDGAFADVHADIDH